MERTGRSGRTHLMALALLVTSADALAAQIIRAPQRMARPLAWTSAAVGWMRMPKAIHDAPSNSYWNLGDAAQYRASLELPLGRATSAGVAMTTARVPIVYAGSAAVNSCTLCDANLTIQQFMGVLHVGTGSSGFQDALAVSAGVTRFTNIQRVDGSPLGTGKSVMDFTGAIAYGVSYHFTPGIQAHLMQEYSLIAHKRAPGKPSNTAAQQTTRIGLRLALGAR